MSINFPTISSPSYPLKVQHQNTSITSNFEDGSMQSRRKFTRSRKTFTVKWESLPQSEYNTLNNFLTVTVGFAANSFSWRNPVDNVTYNVRCTKYENAELKMLNYWDVEIELTEV